MKKKYTTAEFLGQCIWFCAKVAFGALITIGVNKANSELQDLTETINQEKLDHVQLGILQKNQDRQQRQTDQIVATMKQYGAAIQANTDLLKANVKKSQEKH